MRSGKGRASPGPGLGYQGRDKGFFASSVGYEDRADKRANPSTSANPPRYGHMTDKERKAERKANEAKSGPVKSASKSQKARMQRTVERQRRKGLAKKAQKAKQMISDSSKTPGETKPKRTGAPWVRMMPAGYFGGGGKR